MLWHLCPFFEKENPVKKTNFPILLLAFAELFEISVMIIKLIQNKKEDLWLIGAIVIVILFFILGIKANREHGIKDNKELIFSIFLFYVCLAQLVYALFPINILGAILTIPAAIMVIVSIIIFIKKAGKLK